MSSAKKAAILSKVKWLNAIDYSKAEESISAFSVQLDTNLLRLAIFITMTP